MKGNWHLGNYSVEEQAAMAYDRFCIYQVSRQHQDVSGNTHTMHVWVAKCNLRSVCLAAIAHASCVLTVSSSFGGQIALGYVDIRQGEDVG